MNHLQLFEDFNSLPTAGPLTPRDEMMEKLRKRFPNIWIKPAEDFYKDKHPRAKYAIWTGSEGNTFVDNNKKIAAFNPTDSIFYNPKIDKSYDNEVHVTLAKFLRKNGYYAEFYDAGTIFFWPIKTPNE